MTGSMKLAAMLNGRMHPTSGNSRKNRSGLKPEHSDAQVENGLGRIAQKEFDTRIGIVDVKPEKRYIDFSSPAR